VACECVCAGAVCEVPDADGTVHGAGAGLLAVDIEDDAVYYVRSEWGRTVVKKEKTNLSECGLREPTSVRR
jgi:hypothetical protein